MTKCLLYAMPVVLGSAEFKTLLQKTLTPEYMERFMHLFSLGMACVWRAYCPRSDTKVGLYSTSGPPRQ